MSSVSQVYEVPTTPAIECTVRGRIALPGVVMELHHYRFNGQQGGVFSSPRSFLDLALSPRPGCPRGGYGGIVGDEAVALGDVLFIPAGSELHTQWGEGEQTSICCAFDMTGFNRDEPDFISDALNASLDVRSPPVRDALRRLAEEIREPGFCSELLAQAVWMQAGIELQRYLKCSVEDREIKPRGLSQLQLQKINDLIEQPGKAPSVSDLAAECSLSTRHFFRQFKASTGQTLSNYITERKIDRAKQQLQQNSPVIKAIAWDCGFESAAAFSTAFRRATGFTPRQFHEAMVH